MLNCAMRWPERSESVRFPAPIRNCEANISCFVMTARRRKAERRNFEQSGWFVPGPGSGFGLFPTETIVVLLYPNQDFRDITRSPNWVGALNDGKIRVPVSGLTQMTPDLARVLKHELTHSFVRQITLGRCPTWLNEGLAQLEEGSTTAALEASWRAPWRRGNSRLRFTGRIFREVAGGSGCSGLCQIARRAGVSARHFRHGRSAKDAAPIGDSGFNTVLQDEIRMTYPAFEDEVASYVLKKYGS